MDKIKFLTLILAILLAAAMIMMFQWRSANVIANIEEDTKYNVGDSLSSVLVINIGPGESVDINTPMMIGLFDSKNNVLLTKTLNLEEFVKQSNNPVEAIKIDDNYYYETSGIYSVSTDKLMPYVFEKSGKYELMFAVFKLGIETKKEIIVK
jgi:hypothetical protein